MRPRGSPPRSPQRRPAAPAGGLLAERLDEERAAALRHRAVARGLAREQARVPAHLVGVVAAEAGLAVEDDLGERIIVLDNGHHAVCVRLDHDPAVALARTAG